MKFKKILTTTILTISSATAIGCASPNSTLAKKINNGMNDFVSSINKLDYVDTNSNDKSLGKITSAAGINSIIQTATNETIENTITRPADRNDNFKLYVLSESPYITFASDENNSQFSLSMQFSTDKIENTSFNISEKINKLILKRAILMIYVNEIYNGNVNLTNENRTSINAYVNVIKENASYLNGNRGMVKNQLGLASNLIENKNNENMVNYYIIKSGEALEIRANKIDSTISAIDSIISILEQNLLPNSPYYQNGLSNIYNNMLSNLQNASNDNQRIAKNIAESINLLDNNLNQNNTNSTEQNNTNNQNSINQVGQNLNNTKNLKTQNNTTNAQMLQNNGNLLQNNTNNNENSTNQNHTTSQETNTTQRRQRRNKTNSTNKQSNETNTQNNISKQQTNNPPVNPTTNPSTTRRIENNTTTTSVNGNDLNRASRVPYKVDSTSFYE